MALEDTLDYLKPFADELQETDFIHLPAAALEELADAAAGLGVDQDVHEIRGALRNRSFRVPGIHVGPLKRIRDAVVADQED
ncbi:MAG: hypothetical protein KF774_17835 [Planctomyces sp.]|nr:hypothetical protein [Planctomyces sp.]